VAARAAAQRTVGRYLTDPSPWRRVDAVIPGLLAVLGVVVLVVCWFGASGEVRWRDQTDWFIGGCLGAGAFALGAVLWVLVGMREVRRGFADLKADQREILGLHAGPSTRDLADLTGPIAGWVTAAGMTRAHLSTCLLMRGKTAVPLAASDVPSYERCGVCTP
jgi:hypothetical protein